MPLSSLITSTFTSLRALYWLRWLAITGQGVTVLAVHVLLAMPLPLAPLLAVIGLQALVNVATARRLRAIAAGQATVSAETLAVQLTLDILALATLLYLTGGAQNPFVSLFLLPLAIAAALLPIGHTASLTLLTIFLYASLLTDSRPLPPPPPELERVMSLHVFGMWVNFVISAGLIAGFITYLSDQVRASGRQLARTREASLRQEQVLALGTLAAGTAHELGTPLSTIAVLATELESQAPADLREDLALLRQQVDHCKHILGGMRRQAELAREQPFQPVAAGTLVAGVLDKFQLLRPNERVTARIDAAQAGVLVAADATLEQALLNLLNNAADASPHTLELRVSQRQRHLVIDILDRGVGFPPEMLAGIGAAMLSTKGEQGMGIGLLLANATLERLGGDVVFLPRPGGGTIARVLLPVHGLADGMEFSRA